MLTVGVIILRMITTDLSFPTKMYCEIFFEMFFIKSKPILFCCLLLATIKVPTNDKFLPLMLITVKPTSLLIGKNWPAKRFSKKVIGLNVNKFIVVGICGVLKFYYTAIVWQIYVSAKLFNKKFTICFENHTVYWHKHAFHFDWSEWNCNI